MIWNLITRTQCSRSAAKSCNWHTADYSNIRNDLSSTDWSSLLNSKKVEEMWSAFKLLLENSIERNDKKNKR